MLRLAAVMAILLLSIGMPPHAAAEDDIPPDVTAAAAEDGSGGPERLSELATEAETETDAAEEGGEEKGAGNEEEGTENGGDAEEPPTFIDAAHAKVSSGVLATAAWLDSFFADPRFESETSETRIRVRFSVFAEEDETVEYESRANLRLDLPILEHRFQLLIAGDPEEEEDFQALSGTKGQAPELVSTDEDFSASLRYFLVKTLKRNISLRSGVKWRSGMPTVFLEPRYRQSVPLDSWLFRFTQRVIGFTDGRTGVRTTLDLERKLRESLFFRTSADGSWSSDEDGYFYSLGFSVYKRYSPRRVVIYGWGNSFRTEPENRLDEVVLSVRYRQRILRDWLFSEVVPQISFPHERDYEATPGIMLRLEMLFGYYPALPSTSE